MSIVSVDLNAVQQRVDAAVARLAKCENAELQAQAATAAARRELEMAKMLDAAIREYAIHDGDTLSVVSSNGDTPRPAGGSAEDNIARYLGATVGSVKMLTTKQAVLAVLGEDRERAWLLDDLHHELQARGFGGSHNAVHVAVSRLRAEGGPVKRVRQGTYQYGREEVDQDSDPAPHMFSEGTG